MNDGFLMRMLHSLAGLDKELQPLADLELVLIAVLGNRQPGHVFHYEVRLALRCGAGIEHLGDRGVVHDRNRLTLRLEAPHDRLVVHARPDQLQGYRSAHRFGLLGEPHLSHAALAEFAHQDIAPREYFADRQRRGRSG